MAPGAMKWVLAPSLGKRGAEDEGSEGGGAGRGGVAGSQEITVIIVVVVIVVVVVVDDGFALVEFVFARDAARRRLARGSACRSAASTGA